MKFQLNTYHRNVTDEELIQDVKDVAKKLGKDTVTISEYNENGKYNNSTLTRRFGSWFKVLDISNLERSRSELNIPDEKLFENIKNV